MFSSLLQLITLGIFLCLILAGAVVWLNNYFARRRKTLKVVDRSLMVHRGDSPTHSRRIHAHHSVDRSFIEDRFDW